MASMDFAACDPLLPSYWITGMESWIISKMERGWTVYILTSARLSIRLKQEFSYTSSWTLTSEEKFSCIVGFSGKIIDQDDLKNRIKNKTETLLIHGDTDQIVPSINLLEAKDFLIRNNVKVDTLLIKDCDHHIPIQASSTALNYILKKI